MILLCLVFDPLVQGSRAAWGDLSIPGLAVNTLMFQHCCFPCSYFCTWSCDNSSLTLLIFFIPFFPIPLEILMGGIDRAGAQG